MAIGPPFRVAAGVLLTAALLIGCGRQSAESHAAAPATGADRATHVPPRPIDLPAQMRPLASAESTARETAHPISMAATYERRGDSASRSPARIVALSAAKPPASSGVIREPLGGGLAMTTVEPPPPGAANARAAEAAPLELADDLPALLDPPLPELASRPQFAAVPSRDATSNEEPQAEADRTPDAQHLAVHPVYGPAETADTDDTAPHAVARASAGQGAIPPAAYPARAASDPRLLQPVLEQAKQISDRGFAIAQRGMFYAARAELIEALQLVAQGLDAQHAATHHASALASGLVALEEARDFQPPLGQAAGVVDVVHVASGHRTPVLHGLPAAVSPVVAQQQYFAYAQAQLAAAVGSERVGSQTLYRLGKLESALAAHDDDRHGAHAPQAMVFHQAALSVDAANYLAANELGVLLAKYGQLAEARRLLLHSVSLRPHVEGWHNLAVVHRRLGEDELARRAENERALLAKASGNRSRSARLPVEWVDRQAFAATGNREIPWPENAAPQTVSPSPPKRR